MNTHIINLIKTDIHLCRLTEQLKQIGFQTNKLSTNHLAVILFILGIEQTDELTDHYYQSVEHGYLSSPETDDDLASKIFQFVLGAKTENETTVIENNS